MKNYSILSYVIFVLCILFITGCASQPISEPVVIITTPTPITPAETVVLNPTTAPTEPTQTAPLPTAVIVSKVDPTLVAPIDPPTAPDGCAASEPPNGVFYIVYGVQAGDTLFTIGQKTRPNMTVADIAAANCLTDVNRIEVGQELLIWHSPTNGPATLDITFQDSAFQGQWFHHVSPLILGEMNFRFSAEAGQYLIVRSRPESDLLFSLENSNGTTSFGQVSTTERHYFEAHIRGRSFELPQTDTYRLKVTGEAEVLLNFELILNDEPFPTLATPERIQFADGASSQHIIGTTPAGQLNRYVFNAKAGQVVDLAVGPTWPVALTIDDLTGNQLYRSDLHSQPQSVTIPADGDYTLTVCHCASEGYLDGDYDFTISINTPVVTAPVVTQLTFSYEDHFAIATYSGPLAFGEHIFQFNGFAGEYLSLMSQVGQSPAVLYTLEKASDSTMIGSVHSTDRYYVDPQIQGRQFQLPEDGDYRLRVVGRAGSLLDFSLTKNNERDSVVGDLQRIQFPAGYTDTFVTGTSQLYRHDRYVFGASAGQLLDLELIKSTNTHVWLEDNALNIIHFFDPKIDPEPVTLPNTSDYILTVITHGVENGQSPNYQFNLSITDPIVINPIPNAETLTFNEGINGWLGAGASGTLNANGDKIFTFYLGGERHLSLVDRSGSSLNFRIEKADGTTQVGSVSTSERNYLDPTSRGRGFTLPETAQYLLHVSGNPGTAYDLSMVWGGIPHPTLGEPQRIATGANSADVTGENLEGEMDRYILTAAAGQRLEFDFAENHLGTQIQVEDSNQNVILKAEGGAYLLSADGDYTLTVWQPGGEIFGHGPYEFTLTVE